MRELDDRDRGRRAPFAHLLNEEMARRSLTAARLIGLLKQAARDDADDTSVSRQLISKWCNGHVTPGRRHVRHLAGALGLPIELVARKAEEQRTIVGISRRGPSSAAEAGDVNRREFLRLPMGIGAATLGFSTMTDSEALVHALDRPRRIGRAILETTEALIDSYGEQYQLIAPDTLRPLIHGEVVKLTYLAKNNSSQSQSSKLRRLICLASMLAGYVAMRQDERSDAIGYWALCESNSIELDEPLLLGWALLAKSHLYSTITNGGIGGSTELALAALNTADAAMPRNRPTIHHAMLFARRAEEHAACGDADRSRRDLNTSRRILETCPAGTGFFKPWNEAQLDGYRGSCAKVLQQDDAERILADALAMTDRRYPVQRIAILSDLAVAQGRSGAHRDAISSLADAIDLAADSGNTYMFKRIAGARRLLESKHSFPEVEELDMRIAQVHGGILYDG